MRNDSPEDPVTDPVTGFTYPEPWIRKASGRDDLALARNGLAVLTSSGTILRRGFTTGTTAAACCKAAILSLVRPVESVDVTVPCGLTVTVPVAGSGGQAECRKYAGDYPTDATAGLLFVARCTVRPDGMELIPGVGIGRFVRDTPRHQTGEPAISMPARDCIFTAMEEGLRETGLDGAQIMLAIPDGARVGAATLNPKVGIEGGISILGTTGLVEPWDDHLSASVAERVGHADRVVLSTGRIGLRYARLLFPDHEAILAGAKLAEALSAADGEVVLCGLPGLILRFLDPGILDGTGCMTVEELSGRPGFERKMEGAFHTAKERYPGLRIVVIDRKGVIMGDSG
ncbi:MAG: cobalt-precorrin-5B (C(1))-methyltransferase [Methanomicrobiales archaeon]|nr:cobalt-precorrin-5B (C(1))-methyltransferase [Methanomicrobiales archaeon]